MTVAAWSTAILEMSLSLTCTVTVICERTAIWMRGDPVAVPLVPPVPSDAPETAFMVTTLPEEGAVTVRLAACATALS